MANRVERMLRILLVLRSQRPYNAVQISAECDVHRRTVFRDIAALRTLGFALAFDPESACYSLLPYEGRDWDAIPDDELTELFLAACLRLDPSSQGSGGIHRAAIKFAATVTESVRERLATYLKPGDGLLRPLDLPDPPAWLPAMLECIRREFTIVLSFDGIEREREPVRLNPRSLLFERQGWLLEGETSDGRDCRYAFRSARMGWDEVALEVADDQTVVGLVIRESHLPP